jgi:hypothetical protein
MAARSALTLLLLFALALGGCFYALDGSLVNKTRDGGADGARLDGGSDAGPKTDLGGKLDAAGKLDAGGADSGITDSSPSDGPAATD